LPLSRAAVGIGLGIAHRRRGRAVRVSAPDDKQEEEGWIEDGG